MSGGVQSGHGQQNRLGHGRRKREEQEKNRGREERADKDGSRSGAKNRTQRTKGTHGRNAWVV